MADWQNVEEFYQFWRPDMGRKPGLNKRQYAELFPKFAAAAAEAKAEVERQRAADESIRVIPASEWDGILSSADYHAKKDAVPVILDQDGVGSCAWEACTQAVLSCRSLEGQPFVPLNPWSGYRRTNTTDSGSSIDGNLLVAIKYGIAPEALHPRNRGWRAAISAEAAAEALKYRPLEVYDIQSDEEFGSALLQGFFVVYGRSGHAITAIDLVDRNTILFANSWGQWTNCDIPGFGVEKLSKWNRSYGAWAIRATVRSDDVPMPQAMAAVVRPPMQFEPYPQVVA